VREVRTIVAGSLRIRGVTASHPFFEPRRGDFVACAELRVGDRLLSAEGEEVAISSVVAHELSEPLISVVNLTVNDAPPSFFADGALVHNKSYAVPCSPSLSVESAVTTACVGDRFPIRARQNTEACVAEAVPAVFATSHPDLLVIEGKEFDPAQAIARGAGTVTITAIYDGATATTQVAISDCSTGVDAGRPDTDADAGADAAEGG
jgi:hypothetical protein